MGLVGETVKVVDEEGNERLPARFDGAGRLLNADECVGEIVNTAGVGPFEGWGRLKDKSEIPWRDLTVSWVETRAFEPARREVRAGPAKAPIARRRALRHRGDGRLRRDEPAGPYPSAPAAISSSAAV